MIKSGQLPDRNEILEALMDVITRDYLTGVWTSGKIFRACSTSEGTNHWFEKDSFIFDFSLIDEKENMVKFYFQEMIGIRIDLLQHSKKLLQS